MVFADHSGADPMLGRSGFPMALADRFGAGRSDLLTVFAGHSGFLLALTGHADRSGFPMVLTGRSGVLPRSAALACVAVRLPLPDPLRASAGLPLTVHLTVCPDLTRLQAPAVPLA